MPTIGKTPRSKAHALAPDAHSCNVGQMKHILIAMTLASPLAAETPMTADEFEAFVLGKTLTFATTGNQPYGVEYYAPNRQVIWSFVGEECVRGEWYDVATETGTNICFEYENSTETQCWQMFNIDGQLRADFMNRPGTTILFETQESEPLICGGVGA